VLGTDGRSLVQLLFRVPSGWFFMTSLMFLIAVNALNGAFFSGYPSVCVRMFICVCMHTYVRDVHAYIFVWAEAFFNWLAVDV